MNRIPPPYQVQQRASDAAWMLTQEHSEALTLEQLVRMHVVAMVAPERLGWAECGDALSLWSLVVVVRI